MHFQLLCTFNGRRRFGLGIRLPIASRHSFPASQTKLTYHSIYRPPLWQIKTNDHEGGSLPQPELWTGITPVLTVTVTNTQISSHVAYSGELRKISVRPNRIAMAQSGPNLKLSGEEIVMTRNIAGHQYIPEGILTLIFHFDGLADDNACPTSHSRAHHQDTHHHVKTREILLIAVC